MGGLRCRQAARRRCSARRSKWPLHPARDQALHGRRAGLARRGAVRALFRRAGDHADLRHPAGGDAPGAGQGAGNGHPGLDPRHRRQGQRHRARPLRGGVQGRSRRRARRRAGGSSTPRSSGPPTSRASTPTQSSPRCSPATPSATSISRRRAWAGTAEGRLCLEEPAESGAVVVGGSDAPVERGAPLIEFYAAVARRSLDGFADDSWHREERLTREQITLTAFTQRAAFAAFAEEERGQIKVGQWADLRLSGGPYGDRVGGDPESEMRPDDGRRRDRLRGEEMRAMWCGHSCPQWRVKSKSTPRGPNRIRDAFLSPAHISAARNGRAAFSHSTELRAQHGHMRVDAGLGASRFVHQLHREQRAAAGVDLALHPAQQRAVLAAGQFGLDDRLLALCPGEELGGIQVAEA